MVRQPRFPDYWRCLPAYDRQCFALYHLCLHRHQRTHLPVYRLKPTMRKITNAPLPLFPEWMEEAEKTPLDLSSRSFNSHDYHALWERLAQSAFRSKFHLRSKEKEFVREKGMETIYRHATDFVRKRLAPAHLPHDGKQTPMHGHPVFIAQHATGCCCRGCFSKWHHIPAGRELTEKEQAYVTEVLMAWIEKEMQEQ